MFTRIVVGTDGSDTAAEAVRQAIDLAKISGATLSIVSAYAPISKRRTQGEAEGAPPGTPYGVGPREHATQVLAAAAAEARAAGVEVRTHPVEANPADALLNVAEQIKADLIIVGNKWMTGTRRSFLGSVPNNVSHHAPCSVLIIQTT